MDTCRRMQETHRHIQMYLDSQIVQELDLCTRGERLSSLHRETERGKSSRRAHQMGDVEAEQE
jgi:hypothetical protein